MSTSEEQTIKSAPNKMLQAKSRFTEVRHRNPMKIGSQNSIGALVAIFTIAVPGFAHHSYIRIDRSVIVAFEATVLDFDWRNPHVYFRVATVNGSGERV